MAKISRNLLRREILKHLKADTSVTEIQPANRIFPQRVPVGQSWPFSKIGVMIDTPLRRSCVDGETITFAMHTFDASGGDEKADAISSAIGQSLDHAVFNLTDPYEARVSVLYVGGQVMQDGTEADAWHGVANFRATVIS